MMTNKKIDVMSQNECKNEIFERKEQIKIINKLKSDIGLYEAKEFQIVIDAIENRINDLRIRISILNGF